MGLCLQPGGDADAGNAQRISRRDPAQASQICRSVFCGLFCFRRFAGYFVVARTADTKQALFAVLMCLILVAAGLLSLTNELIGKELIELDGYMLKVCEFQFGFRILKCFDITMMKHLTIGAASYWQGSTYVMSNGRIHFEYKSRMVSVGGTIDEDDAFEIVHRIQRQITPEAIEP